jgi:hypothetical protein
MPAGNEFATSFDELIDPVLKQEQSHNAYHSNTKNQGIKYTNKRLVIVQNSDLGGQ